MGALEFKGKVLLVQRRMTHYRVPFFNALRQKLEAEGVELVVAYGNPTAEEASKADGADLDWGIRLKTRYFMSGRICWQPFSRVVQDCDVVVITHENKLICNLFQQFGRRRQKVALWGHGANLQGDRNSLREKFKRFVGARADWWFGYTEFSRPLIRSFGFPDERVTILNNSVDTGELARISKEITLNRILDEKARLGIDSDNVCIYVGSLYSEKRIDFLLDAASLVRQRVPDFELIVVGGGGQRDIVERFCSSHEWAHFVGVRTGYEKVALIKSSKLMLNPGLVGLGVLDSFVCEVPMVTTDCGVHSPEISYLEDGFNGLFVKNDLNAYVFAVVETLKSDASLRRLRDGCRVSASRYTIDNMASNFVEGLLRCIDQPPCRGVR